MSSMLLKLTGLEEEMVWIQKIRSFEVKSWLPATQGRSLFSLSRKRLITSFHLAGLVVAFFILSESVGFCCEVTEP